MLKTWGLRLDSQKCNIKNTKQNRFPKLKKIYMEFLKILKSNSKV